MYGVVSLLDELHNGKVEAIWGELQTKFGVHGVSITPIAHFSYQVAREYDTDRLKIILENIATQVQPFQVRTVGLGIFTGDDPVLYIAIQLDSSLVNLQKRLWNALVEVTDAPNKLYHPHNWQPHITLTHKDVNHELLPQVVRLLAERDFYWTISIDNLAVLGGDDTHKIINHFPLGEQ